MPVKAVLSYGPSSAMQAVVGAGQIILDIGTRAELVLRGQVLELSGCLSWVGVLTLNSIFSFELTKQPRPDWLRLSEIQVQGVGIYLTITNPANGQAGVVSWGPNVAIRWLGQYPPTQGACSGLTLLPTAGVPGGPLL